MKKILFLLLAAFAFSMAAFAQQKESKVAGSLRFHDR